MDGADKRDFNDSNWQIVNVPHGLEILPYEASGGVNYQGVAWYRKHFDVDPGLKDKKIWVHFEAIMGKCKIFCNGKLLKTHYGGYLPIIVDVTQLVE